MHWSHYQRDIFDAVRAAQPGSSIVVNSVAGSGKSTTMLECARVATGTVLVCCFNKTVAKEFAQKAKRSGSKADVRTIHSQAMRAIREWGSPSVTPRKYSGALARRLRALASKNKTIRDHYPFADVRKLTDLARVNLIDPERDSDSFRDMASHHGCLINDPELWRWIVALVAEAMDQGERCARDEVDFTDMVWLAAKRPDIRLHQYDWVMVDEAQDLNRAQLEVVTRSVRPGGRLVFVGDRHQAIYGFSGADSASIENIVQSTSAVELPLSICYRCPKSHIKRASRIVPSIEPRPGAPEGHVRRVGAYFNDWTPGDFILCRTNTPLVSKCYALIRDGVAASIKGGQVVSDLTGLVKKIDKWSGSSLDSTSLVDSAQEFYEENAASTKGGRRAEGALAKLRDQVSTVSVFARHAGSGKPLAAVEAEIRSLFDQPDALVTLSSVHRAKGLEADNVFILRDDLMPLRTPGQLAWQKQQEMNLKYVALTRSKMGLHFIEREQ